MNGVSKLARGFACAVAALCAGSAVNAWADTLGEKTPLPDAPGVGWTRTIVNDDQTVDVVVAFTNTSAYASGYPFEVPADAVAINYLLVGGGGAGGSSYIAGGGGAGGVLTNTAPVAVTAGTSLFVVVGKGGAAAKAKSGGKGASSKLSGEGISVALEAYGGGGGGYAGAGVAGASGGGAAGGTTTADYIGGAGVDGQGHVGGGIKGAYTRCAASGGGGAGEDGGTGGGFAAPGKGGDGILSTITGEEVWYAGGGSGATSFNGTVVAGGRGGGGVGGQYAGSAGQDGCGGGGGGGGYGNNSLGGNGGSGIVVIRYTKVVVASFTYDSDKCVVDLNGTRVVGTSAAAPYNADAVVVATPSSSYEYKSAPSGWDLVDGSITKTYASVTADFSVEIPEPEEKGGEKVAITFTDAVHASKVATVEGIEIGSEVLKGSTVVVVATPNEHYEYASVPLGWEGGATSITNAFVANEATNVVIPEPTPIMVSVNVTGLANTTYTISTNGVVISNSVAAAESAVVQEGTAVTITVTPADEYEYSSKPEGWTKNADGSISREYETVRGMSEIAVPSESFRVKQVSVTIRLSHTATCVVSNGSVAVSGGTVNTNTTLVSTIKLKPPTADGGKYVYESAPEGWTAVAGSEGTFRREYVASAPVTVFVPDATWVPSVKGNQIDNGDLEQIPTKANVYSSGYNWYLNTYGAYPAHMMYREDRRLSGVGGDPLGDYGLIYSANNTTYCKVKITDRKASYKLTYRAKNSQGNQPQNATIVVDVLDDVGNPVFDNPVSQQYVSAAYTSAEEEAWTLGQSEEFLFPSNGTYRIRFTPTYAETKPGKNMGYIDNVRLTMKPANKSFVLLIK